MTVFAIYQNEDGRLVSVTSDATMTTVAEMQAAGRIASDAILQARGYGAVALADSAGPVVWNTTTHAFDAAPPGPVEIEPDDFVAQFTATESQRVYASTDPNLVQFLRRLSVRRLPIDLLGATVTNGLAYIASLGLFDDQKGVAGAATTRPAAIQAWRPA